MCDWEDIVGSSEAISPFENGSTKQKITEISSKDLKDSD